LSILIKFRTRLLGNWFVFDDRCGLLGREATEDTATFIPNRLRVIILNPEHVLNRTPRLEWVNLSKSEKELVVLSIYRASPIRQRKAQIELISDGLIPSEDDSLNHGYEIPHDYYTRSISRLLVITQAFWNLRPFLTGFFSFLLVGHVLFLFLNHVYIVILSHC
jgi:hypothetical protein